MIIEGVWLAIITGCLIGGCYIIYDLEKESVARYKALKDRVEELELWRRDMTGR